MSVVMQLGSKCSFTKREKFNLSKKVLNRSTAALYSSFNVHYNFRSINVLLQLILQHINAFIQQPSLEDLHLKKYLLSNTTNCCAITLDKNTVCTLCEHHRQLWLGPVTLAGVLHSK